MFKQGIVINCLHVYTSYFPAHTKAWRYIKCRIAAQSSCLADAYILTGIGSYQDKNADVKQVYLINHLNMQENLQ